MYRAVKVGNRFALISNTGVTGYIHSIFDKTINIDIKERNANFSLLTLARSDVDEGPSILVTSMQNNESWHRIGAKIGDPVIFTSNAVYLSNIKLVEDISNATVWRAATGSVLQGLQCLPYEEIKLRCDEVALFIKINGKNQGVYPLVTRFSDIIHGKLTCDDDPFIHRFLQGVLTLHNALSRTSGNLQETNDFDSAVKMLLGLGDGLTPSGDDFLAGLLFAMHFAQTVFARKHDALPPLAHVVCENMAERTNEISQHFLHCAAEGQWGRTTEEFMIALFGQTAQHNEELHRALNRKLSYGATSGMDEIFGIMFGFVEMIEFFRKEERAS